MSSFFDMIVEIYDETRGLPKETMNEVVDVMAKYLKDSNTVLDIGCGTGRFTEPLKDRGIEVVGVDISEKMLEKARLKGIDSLVLSDACRLPFKDSSFDSIICVHVLHLISDWKNAMIELKRVGIGNLVSVLRKRSDFLVIEEYREALSNCGYNLKMSGVREQGLKDRAPPKVIVPIKPFKDIHTIKKRLSLLKERKHSYTQDTPHEIHECAIKYLKNKHAMNLNLFATMELEVVMWDIADLSDSINIVAE
ncbi:MAG: class I SAM-dependent methyltransferase [Thermoplasmata archaeon]|nr:MAG: class I SAM-dependent methyltransferase [Thermoplasmata archaeon]